MGRKHKFSKKTAETPAEKNKKKKPLVTMADLQAMSDSDDDDDSGLPPEEEWDDDAKALKKAIEEAEQLSQ